MLILTIENHDSLPDGGPLSYNVNCSGFDIGRDQYLDWTLPDDTRYISGKHCEVRYFDSGYWLYDISTNGTFVNSSSRRVKSPYRLANGDKLEIGEYIISVDLEEEANSSPSPVEESAPQGQSAGGIWQSSIVAPPPIDRRDLMPPAEKQSRAADFMNRIADVPNVDFSSQDAQAPSGQNKDPWGVTGIDPVASTPSPPQPQAPPRAQEPEPFAENVVAAHPGEPSQQPQPPQPPVPQQQPVQAAQVQDAGMEFIRQFAAGANIPVETLANREAGELANELGQVMRIVSAQLMQLLSARAAAKSMAPNSQRTMIEKTENNPLKFMPSPEEAIRTMMTNESASYLDARQSMEQSFSDLQTHQVATYSAMQHAIRELMEDFSPEKIRQSTGNGKKSLLSSGKGKLWEAYETMWNEKTERFENGMLDAFLVLFSEYYQKNS